MKVHLADKWNHNCRSYFLCPQLKVFYIWDSSFKIFSKILDYFVSQVLCYTLHHTSFTYLVFLADLLCEEIMISCLKFHTKFCYIYSSLVT